MYYDLQRQDLIRLIKGTVPGSFYEDTTLLFLKEFYTFTEDGGEWNLDRILDLSDDSIFQLYRSIIKEEIN